MSDISVPTLDWRVLLNRTAPKGFKGWGRVRAAQLNEMRRSLKIAAWGQTLNAILLIYALRGGIAPGILASWFLALMVLILTVMLHHRRWWRRDMPAVSGKVIEQAGYYAVAFGLVWAVPAYLFFYQVSVDRQLAICVVTAAIMAGAAFIFSTVPPAAIAFVAVMGAAASNMLYHSGSPLIAAIGPLYAAGLMVMVLANGRAFMQRRCVEIALEERSDTISLLLKEFESSDADWLWEANRQLCLHNVSPRFARALAMQPDAMEGMPLVDLIAGIADSDEAATGHRQEVASRIERKAPFNDLLVPIEAGGEVKWIELSARPRYDRNGRFTGYRGVGSDVTEAQRSARRIAHMARHDMLTGLPNRLRLLEDLGSALAAAKASGTQCGLLLIDLDRFKSVNDTLGHVAGDHLLQQVSSRFAPIIDREMTAGRLGGDEFAIVIPDLAQTQNAELLSFDIIEALKQPFVYDDQHLFVGASVGLAVGPKDGKTVEELIRNADLALYRAKAEGGNDVCLYEPSLHARAEERRRIELAMRGALDAGEFSLVYQPVVDVELSRIRSCEALLRWTSAELGEVPPTKFIPLAEETGLVGRIGEWVLRNACSEAASWPAGISIAVNVSPLQLNDPGFMLTLISALSQSGLDPHRLELEITETVFLQITPHTQKVLRQIQALGVRLAIDDFGTGYSSLGYLRDSNFDTIKIDRSFVQAARAEDPGSGAIIRAVVALAGSLDMATVAEGVETAEQLELVRSLGCKHIQGYVIATPQAGTAVRDMLARGAPRIAA